MAPPDDAKNKPRPDLEQWCRLESDGPDVSQSPNFGVRREADLHGDGGAAVPLSSNFGVRQVAAQTGLVMPDSFRRVRPRLAKRPTQIQIFGDSMNSVGWIDGTYNMNSVGGNS